MLVLAFMTCRGQEVAGKPPIGMVLIVCQGEYLRNGAEQILIAFVIVFVSTFLSYLYV